MALVALVLIALAAIALTSLDPSALRALPALVLPLLLVLRRYPGERILVVLSSARSRRPRIAPALARWRARPRGELPRGGLLLACSLAVRPPPGAALPAS